MDEPYSVLDPVVTLKIKDLMRSLAENYTIIIVTHNMQQAARVSDMTALILFYTYPKYFVTCKLRIRARVSRCKRFQNIHSFRQLPEDTVPAVKLVHRNVGDEELGAVGIGTGICHRERSNFVFMRGKFILEAIARSAPARAGGVPALRHKTGDYPVEGAAVIKPFTS